MLAILKRIIFSLHSVSMPPRARAHLLLALCCTSHAPPVQGHPGVGHALAVLLDSGAGNGTCWRRFIVQAQSGVSPILLLCFFNGKSFVEIEPVVHNGAHTQAPRYGTYLTTQACPWPSTSKPNAHAAPHLSGASF